MNARLERNVLQLRCRWEEPGPTSRPVSLGIGVTFTQFASWHSYSWTIVSATSFSLHIVTPTHVAFILPTLVSLRPLTHLATLERNGGPIPFIRRDRRW